ncbi:hypothetical protein HBI56_154440 [Parastagonospora nodorum]|nr:hypothetical protein HBH52_139430 [Parastagonospora nodorum]KAH3998591.1 hypothetical protein HBI10_126430 [Parastagonospora nodorum]KAH4024111.1 hypothetical protein HBI13_083120 [Parastagonospora nodorum]KAH4033836.1 hypothetical protein HBI09_113450 [Parastagonospora nodorum]KAH4046385.1 hypothetical protein HBH49_182750 [Parastagonospora nodorum]
MDNWGDPWADNAKSPTKDAVTSPLPPTFAPAPALLSGFLDDAGWGNEEESFGDWSAAPAKEVELPPPADTPIYGTFPTEHNEHSSDRLHWDAASEKQHHAVHEHGDWGGVTLDAPRDEEQVLSEASDSSTTVQANDNTESKSNDASNSLQPDDDSSARTSTSPSEASHNDAVAESPRTSYEEERTATKDTPADEEQGSITSPNFLAEDDEVIHSEDTEIEDLEDVRPTQEDNKERAQSVRSTSDDSCEILESPESTKEPPLETPTASALTSSATHGAFTIETDLLEKLFTSQKEMKQPEPPPDDPIYSTPARKAWYRLTRRQTMREFNHGEDDDNYIRVTWANSHVRSEVNNIVGRWAREDRIAGTGPGARASFYWDSPAPVEHPMHTRQRSSVATASTITPAQDSDPPLSTNVPAAFSWSSASASADPWQQASPGLRSTSSPLVPPPPMPATVIHARKQEVRAASLDLTSQKSGSAKHARNLTAAPETPTVASLISPDISSTGAPSSDPWSGLDILDAGPIPEDNISTVPADNDDEWGEMVSSPTISTPTLTRPTSQTDTSSKNNTAATITTPQSVKSTALWDQSPDAMSATTIVRLQSAISPTSAYFKAKSFVPLGAEQGPIGPGILKPSKRSVSATAKEAGEKTAPKIELKKVPSVLPEDVLKPNTPDDFSEWQTSVPHVKEPEQPEVATPPSPIVHQVMRPMTPPQPIAATVESNIDAWADADFSFFESAPPVAPLAPLAPTTPDRSDPFSVFEGRQRSVSAASSAKTFTRSPPRKVPTPPIQPLTGATSSAQRRKNEEDAIIRDILSGLPNLGYMLR